MLRDLPSFFFKDTATTEIYTLSLHDALPISGTVAAAGVHRDGGAGKAHDVGARRQVARRQQKPHLRFVRPFRPDRKSTRLNSSHANISYAVFCLKKKNKNSV